MSVKLSFILMLLLIMLQTMQTPTGASRSPQHQSRYLGGSKKSGNLSSFLQNVLRSREDLTWIDRVADQMRSEKQISTSLKEKIDAMFIQNNNLGLDPSKNKKFNTEHRFKRKLLQIEDSTCNPVYKDNHRANKSPNGKNVNIRQNVFKFENASITKEKINTSIEKTIQRENNVLIEKIPWKDEYPPFGDTRESLKVTKEKPAVEERLVFGRSLKSVLFDNSVRENLTRLLSPEDRDDRSQVNGAVNGNLAKEIVKAIFNEIKSKDGSSLAINFGFQHDLEPQNYDATVLRRKLNTDLQDDDTTKKLIYYVQHLIENELEKQNCNQLPPDLQEFLHWAFHLNSPTNADVNMKLTEREPTPINEHSLRKSDLSEWYRKFEILENLLDEFDGLSEKDKNKVQAIHEYLESRYDFVDSYIEAKESNPRQTS